LDLLAKMPYLQDIKIFEIVIQKEIAKNLLVNSENNKNASFELIIGFVKLMLELNIGKNEVKDFIGKYSEICELTKTQCDIIFVYFCIV